MGKGTGKTYWCDGEVLYLGGSYRAMCVFYAYKVYFNEVGLL